MILLRVIWIKIQILGAELRRVKAIEASLNIFCIEHLTEEVMKEDEGEEEEEAEQEDDADRSHTPPSSYGFDELCNYGRRLDPLEWCREKVNNLIRQYRSSMQEIVALKRLIKKARKSELYDDQLGLEKINWVSL